MNNSSANSQIRPKKRKIPSWVLGAAAVFLAPFGTIALGLIYTWILHGDKESLSAAEELFLFCIAILYYMGLFVMAIYGLTKGVKELKLSRRRPALAGIILCSIGLLFTILIGFRTIGIILASAV